MDALLGTVEEETELVRAGKLTEAAKLEADQGRAVAACTSRTRRGSGQVRAISRGSTPGDGRRTCASATTCSARVLQMNLTVLATAHAVSESIMRGVSSELARKATPQAYGASGPRQRRRRQQPAAADGQSRALESGS